MSSTRIIIEAVPPDKMRLPEYRQEGCGDWFFDPNGDVRIQVASNTDVWDDPAVFLVAFHELCEARLCFASGVVQGAVDAFDSSFTGEGEPGDDPGAPYRDQHRQSMILEHQMALFMGMFDYGVIL